MRIALVRRGYSASGGAERYLGRFAAGLRAAGHGAVLFCSPDWPEEAWTGDRIAVPGRGPKEFADALQRAKPREHCDLLYSLERVWECDAYRAGDGVHAAWLERRAEYEPSWKGWFRGLQRKHLDMMELERAVFDPKAGRLIIANSQMVAGEIAKYFAVPQERVRVVYNGLPAAPPAAETRAETRARLGFVEGECVALFAGSGWERKGLRFAIEGINRVRIATLLVAGEGKRRGLPDSARVRFLGAVAELRELMEAADVFVLPTIYDPFSNATLEALAAGLPVITTEANGCAEIMRPGEDGVVLARPDDIEGIAAGIEGWGAGEGEEMRQARREYARGFTIERNVRETLQFLTGDKTPQAP
jgi:UDP-glucose:(heptosyl)LPS alpha-1,3-glucosyltransferase